MNRRWRRCGRLVLLLALLGAVLVFARRTVVSLWYRREPLVLLTGDGMVDAGRTQLMLLQDRAPFRSWREYAEATREKATDPIVPNVEAVLGCDGILKGLQVRRNQSLIGHGTVKNVYIGVWKPVKQAVAVLKLRDPKYNGDFSSGMARLRALQGHETIWPLFAVCPQWARYTEYDSEEYRRVYDEHAAEGYVAVFNTAVTALSSHGTLDNLNELLGTDGCPYANNWRTRLRVALDFLHCMAYLHNEADEKNPFNTPLVQKDFKISQFLLTDDLRVKLNDAEAMPTTTDPQELAADARNIVPALAHIFGTVNLPLHIHAAVLDIKDAAEHGDYTVGWMLQRLLNVAHIRGS